MIHLFTRLIKKISFISFAIIMSLSFLHSQITYTGPSHLLYNTCATCGSDTMNLAAQIASDFGPRYLAPPRNPYDWHQGIDFNPGGGNSDVGYRLRSIRTGTISKVSRSPNGTNRLYYIAVDNATEDFGYIHIFPRNSPNIPVSSGGFTFVNTLHGAMQPDKYGILTPDNILLSDCNPCTGYFYIVGLDTITATNAITQNNLIAPLGNSGTVAGHLHLNSYDAIQNNWGYNDYVNGDDEAIDPLSLLDHSGPEFEVSIHNDSINHIDSFPEGIIIEYPGDAAQKIMTRAKIPNEGNTNTYNSSSMNISKVQIKLKPPSAQVFSLIDGPNYMSKILLGATQQEPIEYPNHVNNSGLLTGNWNRTGIMHFAYRDATDAHPAPLSTQGSRPWDDYYFADFITRIHKNDPMNGTAIIAECPDFLRYPDGRYELYSEVTDVRDSTFQSNQLSFVLDNWKPYIKEVNILVGIQQVYYKEWECSGNCIGLNGANQNNDLTTNDFTSGIRVVIKTSETLTNLTLSVPALNITNQEPIIVTGVDSTEFTFEIITGVLPFTGSDLGFHFTGTDLSDNVLISFVNDNVCKLVPYRDSDSTFVDGNNVPLSYGIDSIHGFHIACASAVDSLKSEKINSDTRSTSYYETSVNLISNSDLSEEITLSNPQCSPVCSQNVTISMSGGIEPYEITWSDASYEDFEIQNMNEGVYQYTITDGLCGYLEGEIEISCFELDVDIISQAVCTENDGSITVTPFTGEAPYTYIWKDGPTDQNRTELSEGAYKLTVTDANGCSTIKEVEVIAPSTPLKFATLINIVPSSCTESTGLIDYYADTHKGGFPPRTYEWSNGSTDPYTISNLTAGVYTLTMTDSQGCSITEDHVVPAGEGQPSVSIDIEKTCENTSDGEIEFYIYVEIGPYDIAWDPSLNNNITIEPSEDDENTVFVTLSDLSVGSYCISVTDLGNDCSANICGTVNPIEITEDLIIQNSSIKPSCNFEPNGTISVLASGNIGIVDYQWSNGTNSNVNNNLTPGPYTVILTDECGRSISETFIVEGFTKDINVESFIKCLNTNTNKGTIDLTVTGSNAPYIFKWSSGETSEDITVSSSGTYSVRVTDKNGCYVDESFYVGKTDGDFAASAVESLTTGCDEQLEFLVSTEVTGGQEPYTYNWSDGSSGNELVIPIGNMYTPKPFKYSVTITDMCNDEINLANNFNCDDLCDNDCIKFYRKGKPDCVDECNYEENIILDDVFGCDKLKVKSDCDNNHSYTFLWAAYGPSSNSEAKFKGNEFVDGTDELILTFSGPGTLLTYVINNTTGCSSLKKLWIPKRCPSFWNWLIQEFTTEIIPSGNNNGNSDPLCKEWSAPITNDDNCTTTWQCIDPPNNNIPDDVLTNEEFCFVTNPQGSSADDNLTLLYAACQCNLTGLHLAVGDYRDFCECSEFLFDPSNSDNLICKTNPIKIMYDKLQGKYIYFTSIYENPNRVTPHILNSSVDINTNIVFADLLFSDRIFVNLSVDTYRNTYIHTVSDVEYNQITKYDTTGNLVWNYDYTEKGKSNVHFNYISKNITRLIIAKENEINTVDLDETGSIIQSYTENIQGTYIRSETGESSIETRQNLNDQTLNYNGIANKWSISLPSPIEIVGYSDLDGGNILMFYNYTQPFAIEGQSFSLSDKVSSGALLLDANGTILKNIVFREYNNSSIKNISKGKHNEFAIAGYYSNSAVQPFTTLEDNKDFCSYIKGFKVLIDTENNSLFRKSPPEERSENLFNLSPNPAQNSVIISLDSKLNQEFTFNLLTSSGVSLLKQHYKVNKGKNELNISLTDIPAGIYFIRMKSKDKTYSKKLIKI